MIADQAADDALQCIIGLAKREDDGAEPFSDDVRYQLANFSSNAIQALNEDGHVPDDYHAQAATLWRNYLLKSSPPLDSTRMTFGLTKFMQHARASGFNVFADDLVKAMGKARTWMTTTVADQFFSIAKRCPAWTAISIPQQGVCTSPCAEFANRIVSSLGLEFGALPWQGTDGVQRLAWNAKAYQKGYSCGH